MYYDLTGSDSDYRVTEHRFMIFEEDQVLQLMQPVFADSIEVNAIIDGVIVPYSSDPGYDEWKIEPEYEDTLAISEGKLQDPQFNKLLVNAIKITKAFNGTQYPLMLNYQKFRSSLIDLAILEGIPSEYDPNLLAELVQSVRYLQNVATLGDVIGTSIGDKKLLHEDLTGLNPDNLVEDEIHNINVQSGKNVIIPLCGSFYSHDLVVKNASTGAILNRGSDYLVVGADLPKDRVTQHPSGVFKYIYVRPDSGYIGDISITYRAFGGEPNFADYESLSDAMIQIAHALVTGSFVTTGSLPDHPFVADINRRITILEDWKRALNFLVPKYEFSTTQRSKKFYWYTIASMWKRPTDPDGNIYIKGSMDARIKFRNHDYIVDATITIDMANPFNKLSVKVNSAIGNEGRRLVGLIPEMSILPIVRIIGVNDPTIENSENYTSGVKIQLGVYGDIEDTIHVEHHSHMSSEIIVNDDSSPYPEPQETDIVLPDGETVWRALGALDYVEYGSLVPDDGFLIWRGAKLLDNTYDNTTKLHSYLESSYLSVPVFNKLVFVLQDRLIGSQVTVECPIAKPAQGPMQGIGAIVDVLDGVAVNAVIELEDVNCPELKLVYTAGRHSVDCRRFTLEQILLKA